MSDEVEKAQSDLAQAIRKQKEDFSPILQRELYTLLATEYKIRFDCFIKEGFSVGQALRLCTGVYGD